MLNTIIELTNGNILYFLKIREVFKLSQLSKQNIQLLYKFYIYESFDFISNVKFIKLILKYSYKINQINITNIYDLNKLYYKYYLKINKLCLYSTQIEDNNIFLYLSNLTYL